MGLEPQWEFLPPLSLYPLVPQTVKIIELDLVII